VLESTGLDLLSDKLELILGETFIDIHPLADTN